MKKALILAITIFQTSMLVTAQDSVLAKTIKYKITVHDPVKKAGYLSAFSDSSLFISSKEVQFKPMLQAQTMDAKIDYQNLQQVLLRRSGSTGRGIMYGALSAAAVGALLGLADGSDYADNQGWCIFCMTAGQKAVAAGITFGAIGGVAGGIIGATSRKKFSIGGSRERFDAMSSRLRSKSFNQAKN